MCKNMYILKVYLIHYTWRQNTSVEKISFRQYKNALITQAPTHQSFTFMNSTLLW